jgi:hypothetical protein
MFVSKANALKKPPGAVRSITIAQRDMFATVEYAFRQPHVKLITIVRPERRVRAEFVSQFLTSSLVMTRPILVRTGISANLTEIAFQLSSLVALKVQPARMLRDVSRADHALTENAIVNRVVAKTMPPA